MKNVKKEKIIALIADDTGLSRNTVALVVETLFMNIVWSLSKGNKVTFNGFGSFEMKKRAARTGRNPHTNEPVPIPEKIKVVFNPSQNLKNSVEKELGKK